MRVPSNGAPASLTLELYKNSTGTSYGDYSFTDAQITVSLQPGQGRSFRQLFTSTQWEIDWQGAKVLKIEGGPIGFNLGGRNVAPPGLDPVPPLTNDSEYLAVGQLLGDVSGNPGVLHGFPGARIIDRLNDQVAAEVTAGGALLTVQTVVTDTLTFTAPTTGWHFPVVRVPFRTYQIQYHVVGAFSPTNSLSLAIQRSLDGVNFASSGAPIQVNAAGTFITSVADQGGRALRISLTGANPPPTPYSVSVTFLLLQ